MKTTIRYQNIELTFSDADVANPDDYIPAGEYNPHDVRPWLIHDHGFPVALVFASHLQEAFDIAVDNDKLDGFMIAESDYADYGIGTNEERCARLGNAGEPFDIDALGYVELNNPPFSFAALIEAHNATGDSITRSAYFA